MKKIFKVGDKVIFKDYEYLNSTLHTMHPEFYPASGTEGIVMDEMIRGDNLHKYLIQWAQGTTSLNDKWWVDSRNLKLFKDTKKK